MSQWVAGVDACPDWKWVVVMMNLQDSSEAITQVVDSAEEILASRQAPAVVAIDIPMGLRELNSEKGRGPESYVRGLLGPLKSSVYPVPARHVVHELAQWPTGVEAIRREHKRLSDLAKKHSEPPKGISLQTLGLLPRIKQLDLFLRRPETDRSKIFEIHPEVAFWSMNGERALAYSKKTADGQNERRKLLVESGIAHRLATSDPPKGAKKDDYLDALAALVVAKHIAAGNGRSFPEKRDIDSLGLPIAIWSFRRR